MYMYFFLIIPKNLNLLRYNWWTMFWLS